MMDTAGALLSTEVEKLIEPYVDLGNLLIIDNDPLSENDKIRSELRDHNGSYLVICVSSHIPV